MLSLLIPIALIDVQISLSEVNAALRRSVRTGGQSTDPATHTALECRRIVLLAREARLTRAMTQATGELAPVLATG